MCSRDSDAAVAEALKVSRQTLMQWRNGERRITDEHLTALISLAKEDQSAFMRIREEMAGTPAERKLWGSLLDRIGAAMVVVAVGAVALAHRDAHEGLQAALPLLAVAEPIYIMRNTIWPGRRPGFAGSGFGSRLAYPPGAPRIMLYAPKLPQLAR